MKRGTAPSDWSEEVEYLWPEIIDELRRLGATSPVVVLGDDYEIITFADADRFRIVVKAYPGFTFRHVVMVVEHIGEAYRSFIKDPAASEWANPYLAT